MMSSEIAAVRAEALFVSALQVSDAPTVTQVRAAVTESLRRHGSSGCAAALAQEYGEHPAEAVRRMVWVLATLKTAFPQRPSRARLARGSARRGHGHGRAVAAAATGCV